MTAAFFRGRRRRAAAAAGAVTFGLVVLSACDKPTPMATLTVGSSTVQSEASCYEDGGAIDQKDLADCLGKSGKTIKATVDDKLHIGVDPKIADHGWTVFVDGQPALGKMTKTYRTLQAGGFFQGGKDEVKISIVEVGDREALGVWNFTLKNNS
ncbi:DUF2771 domain-containing protein [Streptomyces sp. AV19]|uniref:DUF2771 domain-containing protein n=1 Tax=Streptomyces sp. AV19 TaxID=2793068 RepID=UPI0018FE7790|nr:DUF2771 domain-containing protein [Streptomyces sp. AV19]MBH1936052.1 DUF2771 domain-containing protein [Streptomyces sp. AV19]MDG4534153.1 DUF2771 domain-containing protein [Streptomyces sp. AV19]